MTRSQVEAILPLMTPTQRDLIMSLLGGPKTAPQLVDRYCISFNQQIHKTRRRFGIPVHTEPIPGKTYYLYSLILDPEPQS